MFIRCAIITGIVYCLPGIAAAQQLTPQTCNTGGRYSANGSIQLESSIVGLTVQDVSTTIIMYTPDFLQPDAGTTTNIPVINNVTLSSSGCGTDNAGTTFVQGNTMIEFTVGEFASLTVGNSSNMVTQGILQPYNLVGQGALPVTGLAFTAKRISNSHVQLNWKTVQEVNNKGFIIERKKDNETEFSSIGFVKSLALNGNSSFSLAYAAPDTNSYTGKTWYRLQQQDVDDKYSYSAVRMVDGNTSKTVTLKAWPVPAVGHFTVMAEGIDKDVLQVFDMSGKIMQQLPIQNGVSQNVNNLPAGTYLLRMINNKDAVVKVIIVQ